MHSRRSTRLGIVVASREDAMPIKVIGAGLGRTGTLSLKVALEELGFARCYHMSEVIAHLQDARVWDAAARGEPVDWETLFQGYQAAVDWPSCSFYEELMRHYPDAKVVLTVRDPERWYDSALSYDLLCQPGIPELDHTVVPANAPFPPHARSADLERDVSRAVR